jgi:PAS domain S-box-containing protein
VSETSGKPTVPRLASIVQREPPEAESPERADASEARLATGPGTPRSLAASETFAFIREVRDYAIYMLDIEGRILTWNEGARTIKGYAAEEIIGESFSRFFGEDDRMQGRPARLLAQAAADGRVEDKAWRVRKDGTRFWADVVITAVHDGDGRVSGFVKVTRDCTENRRAEELLRQSEERMRMLVESVRDYAIFMLDPDGRISSWNSGAERIKGYRATEIVGEHFSRFYPPEAIAARHPELELEIATREGRYEEEGWRVRKDGEIFWANVVITAIHEPDTGVLRGFSKVTRDLTERQHMAERAGKERIRAEQAHSALQGRDEFISVAAHELRTPLAALVLKLQGVASGLRKTEQDGSSTVSPKLTDRLDGALRQVDRLIGLVGRLLDVSAIVQGKLVMELGPTNLIEMVEQVVDDFREPALRAGSELHFRASGDGAGTWDRVRIEQAFVNLLSNAIKYGSGKPVDVTVEATGTDARILVTDHGIGIAPEDLGRIFTRFERAAPQRHYGGLGLGLYIARNIVDAHGGAIHVSSQPGAGTTFIIELPKRPP